MHTRGDQIRGIVRKMQYSSTIFPVYFGMLAARMFNKKIGIKLHPACQLLLLLTLKINYCNNLNY